MTMSSPKLVTIDYSDLLPDSKKDISQQLNEAFSHDDSLGLIAIRNIPGFVSAKSNFLPMAHQLAHLPKDYLDERMTDPPSLYNAGWSHGKEKLGSKPDLAKGSFYFNPITDAPGTESERRDYPASYPRNIWPDETVLPGFENSAKILGRCMYDTVVLLSSHLDRFVKDRNDGYDDVLYPAMKATEKVKGRLLYYFPLDEENSDTKNAEDSWIGWHNDSGFLTALAGDMYVNHDDSSSPSSIATPDENSGLYVMTSSQGSIKVEIPHDCMCVQIGECTQIVTGGELVATPHCVRGSVGGGGEARISCACFVDTVPGFRLTMPKGCGKKQVLEMGRGKCQKVPPLEKRWLSDGMTFGNFLKKTFETYYEWGETSK